MEQMTKVVPGRLRVELSFHKSSFVDHAPIYLFQVNYNSGGENKFRSLQHGSISNLMIEAPVK